jgi:hypothetical protein
MDVGEVTQIHIQLAHGTHPGTPRMAAAPRCRTLHAKVVNEVVFPLRRIHYLMKLSLAEAFRTEEDSNDVVAEVCHAALQRQQAQLSALL